MPGAVEERRAAIDLDSLMDRPLAEISAAEFIAVLAQPTVRANAFILADKKKYELWVEEGVINRISLQDLLEKVRGEKKKIELEVPDWWRWRVNPADTLQLDYGRLVEDVANIVESRIGKR